MPLCEFPIKTGKEVVKADTAEISQDGLASETYGSAGSNAAGNVISSVTNTQELTKAAFDATKIIINTERERRGRSAATMPAVTTDTKIRASHFNDLKSAIQVASVGEDEAYEPSGTVTIASYPAASAPSSFPTSTVAQTITVSHINKLIADINTASNQCTCNCNYCSCNCNYCTCNCNYSCTCNCNYSDVTTKENIAYM